MSELTIAALVAGYFVAHIGCFLVALYLANRYFGDRNATNSEAAVPALFLAPVAALFMVILVASLKAIELGRKHSGESK